LTIGDDDKDDERLKVNLAFCAFVFIFFLLKIGFILDLLTK